MDVTIDLPHEGDLVRIPFLISSNPWYTMSSTTTKANTVTKTGTTAGITYAELRFLGLLVQISASVMSGPVHFRLTSCLAQGGLQVMYGNQLGIVEPLDVTGATKGNTAWGQGWMFLPGLRTKPKLSRQQTIQATLATSFLVAGSKTQCVATIEAVCERVSDPMAERIGD